MFGLRLLGRRDGMNHRQDICVCGAPIHTSVFGYVHDQTLAELRVSRDEAESINSDAYVFRNSPHKRGWTRLHLPHPSLRVYPTRDRVQRGYRVPGMEGAGREREALADASDALPPPSTQGDE